MFAFVVRRLHWLARIPLLPQIFDAILVVMTALLAPRVFRARERLEFEICREPGIGLSVHRFGGVGFDWGRHELAHLHGNGLFDALVGSIGRTQLIASGKALPHHLFPNSNWISFWIESEADIPSVMEILKMARAYRTLGGEEREH